MTVPNALSFLRQIRDEEDLRRQLEAAPRGATMAALCRLAGDAGKPCQPSHIEQAFWIEWAARRAHFAARAATP